MTDSGDAAFSVMPVPQAAGGGGDGSLSAVFPGVTPEMAGGGSGNYREKSISTNVCLSMPNCRESDCAS